MMNKATLLTRIVAALESDMDVLRRAAQTAYETATAEENIAENKYDTLGLEASYLATGQARRTAEIRQALLIYQQLVLRDYDPARGVQIGSLVTLEDEAGAQRQVFLGPEAAGLKIGDGAGPANGRLTGKGIECAGQPSISELLLHKLDERPGLAGQ